MGVFITRTKTRHVRNAAVFVAICATVAGSVLVGRLLQAPLTATFYDAVTPESNTTPVAPTETTFPHPREIDWEGIVFGSLMGGRGLAIRRSDTGTLFQAYMADDRISSVSEGRVRIRGQWTGTSCAYEQTLFKGQCTPTVDIDVLEILPISLE